MVTCSTDCSVIGEDFCLLRSGIDYRKRTSHHLPLHCRIRTGNHHSPDLSGMQASASVAPSNSWDQVMVICSTDCSVIGEDFCLLRSGIDCRKRTSHHLPLHCRIRTGNHHSPPNPSGMQASASGAPSGPPSNSWDQASGKLYCSTDCSV